MKLEDLTFGSLIGLVAVALLLIGIYNTIMTALKNHREEKKRKAAPVEALESRADNARQMLQAHDEMIKADRERLDKLEEQQRIMLRALMAMLSHEVNGNSTDKLKASVVEINDFLIKK